MAVFGVYKGSDVLLFHRGGNFDDYSNHVIYNLTVAPNNFLYAEMTRPGNRTVSPQHPTKCMQDASFCGPYAKIQVNTRHRSYVILSVLTERDTQFVLDIASRPYVESVPLGIRELLEHQESLLGVDVNKLPLPKSLDWLHIEHNMICMEKAMNMSAAGQK